MGTSLSMNFKDGNKRTTDQKLRLGVTVLDDFQDTWSYVQFRQDVEFGDVVSDTRASALLSNSGIGGVTRDQAVGTNQLQDTGEFGADNDKHLAGAIGYIHTGDGAGQTFFVKKVLDDDTLEIEVLCSPTGITRGGWAVALDGDSGGTQSGYSLFLPGYVSKADADSVGRKPRGVAQASANAGEYGYVKQIGWGFVSKRAHASAHSITASHPVMTAANGDGLAEGLQSGTIGTLSANIDTIIGTYHHATIPGATNIGVVPVYLNIQNEVLSYRFPDDKHALNIVNITGSLP